MHFAVIFTLSLVDYHGIYGNFCVALTLPLFVREEIGSWWQATEFNFQQIIAGLQIDRQRFFQAAIATPGLMDDVPIEQDTHIDAVTILRWRIMTRLSDMQSADPVGTKGFRDDVMCFRHTTTIHNGDVFAGDDTVRLFEVEVVGSEAGGGRLPLRVKVSAPGIFGQGKPVQGECGRGRFPRCLVVCGEDAGIPATM